MKAFIQELFMSKDLNYKKEANDRTLLPSSDLRSMLLKHAHLRYNVLQLLFFDLRRCQACTVP